MRGPILETLTRSSPVVGFSLSPVSLRFAIVIGFWLPRLTSQ
jgi:hypothetical protein